MQSKKRGLALSVSLILGVIAISILCILYSGNATETVNSTTGLTANSPSGVTANNASSLKDIILAKVSEREKVSINNLKVVHAVTIKPENIYRFKILDKKAGRIYVINLDSNYKEMDKCDVDNLIESKRKSEFVGKLSKRLVKKMEEMKKSGESHIKVSMWIKPDKKLPQLPRERLTDQEQESRLKEIRNFYANQKSTNSVVKKLESMGHQTLYRSQYAPLIFVRMPINDVTKVEGDTNICGIYASGVMKTQLHDSAREINANDAWHSDPNITGCSDEFWSVIPRVAVIDTDVKEHTSLPGPIEYFDPNHKLEVDHGTGVMGIIASGDSFFKGVAYGVCRPLLSANAAHLERCTIQDPNGVYIDTNIPIFDANDVIDATEWAISKLVTVINCSFGQDTGLYMEQLDEYFDHIVRNYYRTVVVAAGNNSVGCETETGNVNTPGLAWNVITVGGFYDNRTWDWGDDSMYPCSSYKNPLFPTYHPYDERQKPELVAPGEEIATLTFNNEFRMREGTSLAAPHVSGAAALLIDKDSSLEAWPEEIAAILMASAIHDIEDGKSEQDDPNINPYANPFLHDKDGVGAIDIASAMQIIDNGLNSHYLFSAEDLPYEPLAEIK